MGIFCFKKENLHYVWDDSIVDMRCMCADSLGSLYDKLEDETREAVKVVPGDSPSYPFVNGNGTSWRFVYVIHSATDEPGDDPVKQAFMDGQKVLRRYGDEEWEVMHDTSYFDLPGYEYMIAEEATEYTPARVSNKALAAWLAKGKGLLLDVRSNYVDTTYTFVADDMYDEVPAGYKVMPIGCSAWLEPTEDVLCEE